MNGSIKEFITKNIVPLTIWVVGLLFAALNLILASQLAPLNQSISSLNFRVSAVENTQAGQKTDIDSVKVIQSQLVEIRDNVREVKNLLIQHIER